MTKRGGHNHYAKKIDALPLSTHLPPLPVKHKDAYQKLADRLTSFFGSWTFILIFIGILIAWVIVNVIWVLWDPYPFILLNLFLSCLAALQAPLILISQNRMAELDHIKAERDYAINRRADRGIRRDLEDNKEIMKRLDRILRKLNS